MKPIYKVFVEWARPEDYELNIEEMINMLNNFREAIRTAVEGK